MGFEARKEDSGVPAGNGGEGARPCGLAVR